MDGSALPISIGLQYGVPLKALEDKLTNTRFEPSGFTENPTIRYVSSVLDYIAPWLGGKFLSPEYLKPQAVMSEQELIIQTGTTALLANTRDPESIAQGKGSLGFSFETHGSSGTSGSTEFPCLPCRSGGSLESTPTRFLICFPQRAIVQPSKVASLFVLIRLCVLRSTPKTSD